MLNLYLRIYDPNRKYRGELLKFYFQMFGRESSEKAVTLPRTIQSTSLKSGRNSDVVYCPIRTKPDDILNSVAVYFSIYLPTLLGPVITFMIFIVTFSFVRKCPAWKVSSSSNLLLPLLIIVHLTTYSTHLLISEILQLKEFSFLLVKYCAGFAHIILVPIIAIITKKDIREGVIYTFRGQLIWPQNEGNQIISSKSNQVIANT